MNQALLTDFYEITMANGYFLTNKAETEAVFHLFYRTNVFNLDYCLTCGLTEVIEYLKNYKFTKSDISYLASLTYKNKKPLFGKNFLNYLTNLKLTCHIDAIAEGTKVSPHQPLLRIQGPLLQCQLLETPLINLINYGTLIATKAAAIRKAAGADPIMEFGLRRAHGPNGGLMASRAAHIGGCTSTSNTLAGKLYGIPVVGTVAHSWVMTFDNEREAFAKYIEVMPEHVVFIIDTYDTIMGVKNAIDIGKILHTTGHKLFGVRLDSGDLNTLSHEVRKLLDQAGFLNTKIIASGDLDEHKITELKSQKAPIDIWGVGTKLTTAYDCPAMNMVYKLGAIKDKNNCWQYKKKLSNTPGKSSNGGILQTRRFFDNKGNIIKDITYDINKAEPTKQEYKHKDLLEPISW